MAWYFWATCRGYVSLWIAVWFSLSLDSYNVYLVLPYHEFVKLRCIYRIFINLAGIYGCLIHLLKCRTFTQISVNWPDTEQMREELDDLQVTTSLVTFALIDPNVIGVGYLLNNWSGFARYRSSWVHVGRYCWIYSKRSFEWTGTISSQDMLEWI